MPATTSEAQARSEPLAATGREYLVATGIVLATAGGALLVRDRINIIDVAMALLLAVVIAAGRSRRGPALFAAVLAILTLDVLFVPPYYRLTVEDADYLLTFAVMLVVAVMMSGLTVRNRQEAVEATRRARVARARFDLNTALASAVTSDEVLRIAVAQIERVFGAPGRAIRTDVKRQDAPSWPSDGIFSEPEVRLVATLAWQGGEPAGAGTSHGADAEATVVPVVTGGGVAAVLVFPTDGRPPVQPQDVSLAGALAEQAGAALERVTEMERHEATRHAVDAERLRTALLSSLSHDLRTPLANIEGAASSLLEDAHPLHPDVQRELAESILAESRRMHRLVVNLLDMVRVESESLAVTRTWQPLEEVVGVALIRMEERLGGREVTTTLPDDLPLVPIDDLLVEQVLINLLENAVRHTPPGSPIDVRAWPEGSSVVVEVADRGAGVHPAETELVFEKFHRARAPGGPSPVEGAGLGLAICRGIIRAHGGRIWVEARPGGGAAFRFTLPLPAAPPTAPPEADES